MRGVLLPENSFPINSVSKYSFSHYFTQLQVINGPHIQNEGLISRLLWLLLAGNILNKPTCSFLKKLNSCRKLQKIHLAGHVIRWELCFMFMMYPCYIHYLYSFI